MKKIAIIGVGQLGSRHLQGLTSIKSECEIELVEPFEAMQKIALERYEQMSSNSHIKAINFFTTISELSDNLDVVIVATTADIRRKVVDELIEKKKVKNIILEKVLFQKYDDYDYFLQLFEQEKINVWVNHPRRLFNFYNQFENELKKSQVLSYHVQGSEWGLACNALHFIDHIQMLQLSSDYEVNLNTSMLLDDILESKRKGFYEVYGTLSGTLGNTTFSLTCSKGEVIPATISILADTVRLVVDESQNTAFYARKENNWQWEEYKGKILYFQSELTGNVVNDILTNETCQLPTYKDASKIHKPFIKTVQEKIESQLEEKLGYCPIS